MGVLDAMPSSNLKPEGDDSVLEADRVYRTTYMFSATMPPACERLARKYMRRPCVITIGTAGRATDNVTQKVYMLKENEKANRHVAGAGGVGCKQRAMCMFVDVVGTCRHEHTVCMPGAGELNSAHTAQYPVSLDIPLPGLQCLAPLPATSVHAVSKATPR